MNGSSAPCPKCLAAAWTEETQRAHVREYVAQMPPKERATEAAYAKRLRLCENCVRCSNGLCVLCGCFVQARAAKRSQRCADTPARW